MMFDLLQSMFEVIDIATYCKYVLNDMELYEFYNDLGKYYNAMFSELAKEALAFFFSRINYRAYNAEKRKENNNNDT